MKWTEEDKNFVIDNYPTHSARWIGERLNKKTTTVQGMVVMLGLRKFHYERWPAEEIRFLRIHYPTDNTRDLAKRLGRNIHTVKTKVQELGLHKAINFCINGVREVKKMSEPEKAWLACAIDGEGSIRIMKSRGKFRRRRVFLRVFNTDQAFVKYCKRIVGDGGVYVKYPSKGRSNVKTIYEWRLTLHYSIREILAQIMPYLIIKKDLAKKAMPLLQYISNQPTKT